MNGRASDDCTRFAWCGRIGRLPRSSHATRNALIRARHIQRADARLTRVAVCIDGAHGEAERGHVGRPKRDGEYRVVASGARYAGKQDARNRRHGVAQRGLFGGLDFDTGRGAYSTQMRADRGIACRESLLQVDEATCDRIGIVDRQELRPLQKRQRRSESKDV